MFIVITILSILLLAFFVTYDEQLYFNSEKKKEEEYRKILLQKYDSFYIPIIKTCLYGEEHYFIIDTGSDINLIKNKFIKKFELIPQKNEKFNINSASSINIDTENIYNISFKIEDNNFNTDFCPLYNNLYSSLEELFGKEITGILGMPFLYKYEGKIDFKKKPTILFSKNDK